MNDKLKLLLGIADNDYSKDDLLELLLNNGKEYAIDYCNLSEYNSKLDSIVLKMVVQDYNRLGNEGVASQSFSGVSESFTDGYSADILKQLNKHRKVKVL